MKTTKDGKAIYLHCLPADITGVSCEKGEVEASVLIDIEHHYIKRLVLNHMLLQQ